MDFRDDYEVETLLFGEDDALDNITIGMVKQYIIGKNIIKLFIIWGL